MSALMAALTYREPIAAMAWLEQAFGFETALLVTDEAGQVAHAEMSHAGLNFCVMGEWESPQLLGPARMRSPVSLEGVGSCFMRVEIINLDAHCEKARAAGAWIVQAPKDQFYGARTYRALDLEGHVWNFSETLPDADKIDLSETGLTVHAGAKA
jgi:uncharacterized glyoxalase superfamily protein PhnB